MAIPADYTTLENVRRAIMQSNLTVDNSDDPLLKDFIRAASGFISKRTVRHFVPEEHTYKFDYTKATLLEFGEYDLIEMLELINGNGQAIDTSKIFYAPRNSWPKYRVELGQSVGVTFQFQNDRQEAINVFARWGYHENPATMWVDTAETVATGGLAVGIRVLGVTDPEDLDDEGRKRFEIKQYLQIDNEIMQVLDIVTTGDDAPYLRLKRGAQNTETANHLEGAVIYRYNQDAVIETICTRLCVWLYQHRDVTEGATQLLNGAIILKDTTLTDIWDQLDSYQKPVMYST